MGALSSVAGVTRDSMNRMHLTSNYVEGHLGSIKYR